MKKNMQYFEQKYAQIWGKGTLNKLLQKQKELISKKYIRVNISKTSSNVIEDFLKKNRVKYSQGTLPNSFEIHKTFFNLTSSPQALLGEIYNQDIASQIPVHCLNLKQYTDAKKPIKILDMAASPGSKTTQLSDLLTYYNVPHEIVALELEEKRVQKLLNNLQKQQVHNCKVFNVAAQDFKSSEQFDIILLDAPCSGNLIDDRNWISKRNKQGIEKQATLQKQLLKKAYSLLKGKGVLLYSTCSIEVEENEMNANWFVNNYKVSLMRPNVKLPFPTTPLTRYNKEIFTKEISKTIRCFPLTSNTQGFYIAVFEKN